jgi:hypothetical protein
MAPLPPLVQPPGFINDQLGDVGAAGILVTSVGILAAGVSSVVKTAIDALASVDLSKLLQNNTGIVKPPTNELAGPASFHPADTGGRWAGIPGVNATWEVYILLDEGLWSESSISGYTHIPVSHTVIGPFRTPYEGEHCLNNDGCWVDDFIGFGPNGEQLTRTLLNDVSRPIINHNRIFDFSYTTRKAYLYHTNDLNHLEPEKLPDQRPYQLLPPLKPSTKPLTKPLPTPQPTPDTQRAPFPDTPPFRQPDPTPTTPKPQEAPKVPLPFLPLPNPSTTPKPSNPTNTQPQGGLVPAPKSAPAVTPTTAHFIGNQKVTANGPQPTMTGISQELGRLESKLTTGTRNNHNIMDDLSSLLQLTNLIKNLIDDLFDDEAQKFYTITSPCETDTDGNRIEFKSTIAASSDRIGAVINRLNAIADLLQHTKNLKQPACPRERNIVTGEPVTVNFQQID